MKQGKDIRQEIEQEIRKDIRQIRQIEETAVEQLELQMAAISDNTRRIWRHIQRPVATLCAFVLLFNTIPVHAYAAEEGTESILTEAVPDLTSDPLTESSLFSEPDPAAVTVPETAAPEPTAEPASALESLLQEPAPAPESVQEQVSVQPETPQTTATENTEPVTDPSSGTGIGIVEYPAGGVDQNSTDTTDTLTEDDSSNMGSPETNLTVDNPEEEEAAEDPIEATRTYYFIVRDEEVSRQIVKNGDTLSRPETPEAYEEEDRDGTSHQYVFEAWYIEDTEEEPPFGVIDDIAEDAPENEDILVIASFEEQEQEAEETEVAEAEEEEERIEATRTYHFLVRDEEVNRQKVKNGDTLSRPATPESYEEEDRDGETHQYVFEAWYIEDTEEEPPFGVIRDIAEDAPENEDILVIASFEEQEKEETYPAQTFRGSTSQVRVEAEADEGVFPENTTMQVEAVSRDDAIEAAQEAIDKDPSRTEEVVDAVAVDITFYNEDGEEIQPRVDGGVHVKLEALRT
ncbi:MAG: hypothetical protein IJQ26_01395, partial [Lachnospiraceae bacterium]|nr:hypothetical protein [Lachnospiraceae bacterium]